MVAVFDFYQAPADSKASSFFVFFLIYNLSQCANIRYYLIIDIKSTSF